MTLEELAEKIEEAQKLFAGPPLRAPAVLKALEALARAVREKDARQFDSGLNAIEAGIDVESKEIQRCARVWHEHEEDSWRLFSKAARAALKTVDSVAPHPATAKQANDLGNTLGKHRIELRRAQATYRDLTALLITCHEALEAAQRIAAPPGDVQQEIAELSSLADLWDALSLALLSIVRKPCCLMHQSTALSLLAKAAEPEAAVLCRQAFTRHPNGVYQTSVEKMALQHYPMTPPEFARYGTAKKITESLSRTRFHRALRYVLEVLPP